MEQVVFNDLFHCLLISIVSLGKLAVTLVSFVRSCLFFLLLKISSLSPFLVVWLLCVWVCFSSYLCWSCLGLLTCRDVLTGLSADARPLSSTRSAWMWSDGGGRGTR